MNLIDLADIHAASMGIDDLPFPGAMLLGDAVPQLERRPSTVKRQHWQTADKATKPLTPRQREVLDLITASINRYGFPPTFREIQRGMGLKGKGVGGVAMHVAALVRKGYVKKHDHQMRTLTVVKEAG